MAEVPYNPAGVINASFVPNSVQATPQAFGANVGGAIANAGQDVNEVAQGYQKLLFESAANHAEVGYIKDASDLKAKYMQLEGAAAEDARPQFEQDITATAAKYRSILPGAALRQFDANTLHFQANTLADASSYAAGQVKKSNLDSHAAIADAAVLKMGDINNVINPDRFAAAGGDITHSVNSIADIKGLAHFASGTDESGKLTFGDTPDAQAAKAQYDDMLGKKQGERYLKAAETLNTWQGPTKAADFLQQNWDRIPDAAKPMLNQYIAPKLKNEAIGGAVQEMNADLDAKWNQHQMSNIPSSAGALPTTVNQPLSVRNNNPGNLRDSATGQFRVFDTPEAGAAAMQSDLTAKVSGNSPPMEKNFGKGYSPTLSNVITTYAPASDHNDTQAYIQNVSKQTGFAPDQVLTTADIPKLQAAMSKVESGGSGGNIPHSAFPQYPNKADMLRDNLEPSVQSAVNKYLDKYPDDYYGSQIVERRARSEIGRQISVEDSRLRSDRDIVQNAIGGALTKGQPPATYAELASIPEIKPVLDRVHSEQGDFASTLDTRIAKAAHGNTAKNSHNGFDAITTALESEDKYTQQQKIEFLSKGLGTENPGYSITQKDFNDAKPALDLDPQIRTKLLDTMHSISKANGDVDGMGKQRAVQYYQNAMTAYNNKGDKMSDSEFAANLKAGDSMMPSRQQQIANIAAKQQAANNVLVINPNGDRGYIPAANVEKALAAGFKRVQ